MNIPDPIFKKNLSKISWQKIYVREYGVQYSELAISILAFATYHFPTPSFAHVVIPEGEVNTAFYIDKASWNALVEGLNKKYTTDFKELKAYEKQFLFDGKNYLEIAKKIAMLNLKNFSNKELLSLFHDHQDRRNCYSVFIWSAFILNNYTADHATHILDTYIEKHGKENKREQYINALFKPEKLAAVLELQQKVEKYNKEIPEKELNNLYEKYKWLSCLDIHNNPWTKKEFKNQIKSFNKQAPQKQLSFDKLIEELNPSAEDLEYLKIAKRFVYIKDARDDFRRESVFYAGNLYKELAKRMDISLADVSYLQEEEIIDFLYNGKIISKQVIRQRRKGFVLYLDENNELACMTGGDIKNALKSFNLLPQEEAFQEITGRTASKGKVTGVVAIVKGIKDLKKVKKGNILVAVTTHPDYVSAMRLSAAIVTNEGGITSHAAIVSREYGIPCIVGTKNATQILKDGDMVEVDADNGTVKLVN